MPPYGKPGTKLEVEVTKRIAAWCDYEQSEASATGWIFIALIPVMLRGLT